MMSNLGGVPHDGKGPAMVDYLILEKGMKYYPVPDKINPSHYNADGIECHAVQRAVLGPDGMAAYWHGCALKYLFRALKKNGAEDIRKAIRCLQFWLEEPNVKA